MVLDQQRKKKGEFLTTAKEGNNTKRPINWDDCLLLTILLTVPEKFIFTGFGTTFAAGCKAGQGEPPAAAVDCGAVVITELSDTAAFTPKSGGSDGCEPLISGPEASLGGLVVSSAGSGLLSGAPF